MNVLVTYDAAPAHIAALQQAAPDATIALAPDECTALRLIPDADAVLGNRFFLQALPRAERLRWMQSNSVGVDLILAAGAALDGVTLTCARGVYDDEVAEHAVALALALARGIQMFSDAQRAQRWERKPLVTLSGRRALILGWGGVGRGIARRLHGLGMQVEGVRRRHDGAPAADGSGFVVHGAATWRAALPAADLLVLALPLTHETRALVSARELDTLPRGALVVNVGRGATLDVPALLPRLADGALGGAALDALEQEPPAAGDTVWSARNLLLTPHVGRSPETPPWRWEPLFLENLRRYAAGEPLLHLVDRALGY